jgi:hypothetical protein
MDRAPVVSAMPMALIGRLKASARVVNGETMSIERFAVRQSRVGPLWSSIKALLEPFPIKKTKIGPPLGILIENIFHGGFLSKIL